MAALSANEHPATAGRESRRAACDFCRHLDAAPPVPEQWAVLAEDAHFVAVPSIGALVPGWMLIVPRQHELSLAALDTSGQDRLWRFANPIAERVAVKYGPVSLFEHGPAKAHRPVGCGVDRAHLHIVPTRAIDLLRGARTHFPDLRWTAVPDLVAARHAVRTGDDYLYLETPRGERWLATGSAIPSQVFRRVIAAELGRPHDFNWRTHPQLGTVRRTIEYSLDA